MNTLSTRRTRVYWRALTTTCARIRSSNASRKVSSVVPSSSQRSTIFALATPPGKGGVAVVRVSGPDALQVYHSMVRTGTSAQRGRQREIPEPRRMVRCSVVDPVTKEVLDDGIAAFFKSPQSFTTEDVLELHIHSSRATIRAVLSALSRLSSTQSESINIKSILLRPAEPGEFTRRAFDGGRLDLTQVEALRDLINAETESQRKLALSAVGGSAQTRLDGMRASIVKAMAMMEALIDFGENDSIEDGIYDEARALVTTLQTKISSHLNDNRRGEILRSGVRMVIFGPPNAGKSSLLNFFAQRDAAIVTEVPGTTRDIIELSLDIGGLAVLVSDTAGIRETNDTVEGMGIERALEKLTHADVSICVLSYPEVVMSDRAIQIPKSVGHLVGPNTFVLLNKLDLMSEHADIAAVRNALPPCAGVWAASLSTNDATTEFLTGLGGDLVKRFAMSGEEEVPLITTTRQRTHLQEAQRFLNAFLDTDDVVLAAEELRYASDAVGKVTGAISVEEVLDAVFKEFCIGK